MIDDDDDDDGDNDGGGISLRLKLTRIIIQLLFLKINGIFRLRLLSRNGSLECRVFHVLGMM